MATATHIDRSARLRDPSYQAFLLLRTVFTVAPILSGWTSHQPDDRLDHVPGPVDRRNPAR